MAAYAVVTSCSVRPAPVVVQRDYETDSMIRRICAGYNYYYVVNFGEPPDSAKQRLLDSVKAECPHYQILQEGTDSEQKIVSYTDNELNVFTNKFEKVSKTTTVEHPCYWVRYRCK
jgi:hypothetical protein